MAKASTESKGFVVEDFKGEIPGRGSRNPEEMEAIKNLKEGKRILLVNSGDASTLKQFTATQASRLGQANLPFKVRTTRSDEKNGVYVYRLRDLTKEEIEHREAKREAQKADAKAKRDAERAASGKQPSKRGRKPAGAKMTLKGVRAGKITKSGGKYTIR